MSAAEATGAATNSTALLLLAAMAIGYGRPFKALHTSRGVDSYSG